MTVQLISTSTAQAAASYDHGDLVVDCRELESPGIRSRPASYEYTVRVPRSRLGELRGAILERVPGATDADALHAMEQLCSSSRFMSSLELRRWLDEAGVPYRVVAYEDVPNE